MPMRFAVAIAATNPPAPSIKMGVSAARACHHPDKPCIGSASTIAALPVVRSISTARWRTIMLFVDPPFLLATTIVCIASSIVIVDKTSTQGGRLQFILAGKVLEYLDR